MIDFASDRVAQGKLMPGLVVVRQSLAVASAIESILVLSECSMMGEWEGRIIFLPL